MANFSATRKDDVPPPDLGLLTFTRGPYVILTRNTAVTKASAAVLGSSPSAPVRPTTGHLWPRSSVG